MSFPNPDIKEMVRREVLRHLAERQTAAYTPAMLASALRKKIHGITEELALEACVFLTLLAEPWAVESSSPLGGTTKSYQATSAGVNWSDANP